MTAQTNLQDPSSKRLVALDLARGFIMLLMALDHTVAFVYRYHPSEVWAGAWTRYQSVYPFLARFVTHLCAPGFFLLMGAGVALFLAARQAHGWSVGQARWYLVKRGLLLLFINQVLENRIWSFGFAMNQAPPPALGDGPWPGTPGPVWFAFTVLSGLGLSLCLSALVLTLKTRYLALLGSLVLLSSALVTPGPEHLRDDYHVLWRLLFLPGHSGVALVLYPLIPWSGLALWGLTLGRLLHEKPAWVQGRWAHAGLGLVCAALLLRVAGGFGNLRLPRDDSAIEFLNLVKYPPALVFTLLFIGLNLLLLSFWQRAAPHLGRVGPVLATFGQVPLFFYLTHLFLYCGVGALWWRKGASLPVTLLVWIAGLVPLYFLCRRYRRFKAATPQTSVWRFF